METMQQPKILYWVIEPFKRGNVVYRPGVGIMLTPEQAQPLIDARLIAPAPTAEPADATPAAADPVVPAAAPESVAPAAADPASTAVPAEPPAAEPAAAPAPASRRRRSAS
jgi:hypothetical protein